MRKQVMVKAWEIAKKAAARHGHKASEYIGESMKIAWALVKKESEASGIAECEQEDSFEMEARVNAERKRVKDLMKSYQDDIRGRWKDIEKAGLKKAAELGLDEKQEFQAINQLKLQFDTFVNWVPEYDDLENVKQIHQNMINYINA